MKGYLLFVEGQHTPTVVHLTEKQALDEAKRLAREFPGKVILLLQMVKRLQFDERQMKSLGSHIPIIKTSQLTHDPNKRRRPILTLKRKDGASHV